MNSTNVTSSRSKTSSMKLFRFYGLRQLTQQTLTVTYTQCIVKSFSTLAIHCWCEKFAQERKMLLTKRTRKALQVAATTNTSIAKLRRQSDPADMPSKPVSIKIQFTELYACAPFGKCLLVWCQNS